MSNTTLHRTTLKYKDKHKYRDKDKNNDIGIGHAHLSQTQHYTELHLIVVIDIHFAWLLVTIVQWPKSIIGQGNATYLSFWWLYCFAALHGDYHWFHWQVQRSAIYNLHYAVECNVHCTLHIVQYALYCSLLQCSGRCPSLVAFVSALQSDEWRRRYEDFSLDEQAATHNAICTAIS